jgi:glycine cleavage system aminomethyltransferase T
MHMTHTGEQGYVLYIPNEFAVEIYDSIMEAGLILNIKCRGSLFYQNFVKFTNFQMHRYLKDF